MCNHSAALKKREMLNSNLKSYHFAIIDLIENEKTMGEEQEILDDHNDIVSFRLNGRLQDLVADTGAIKSTQTCHRTVSILA